MESDQIVKPQDAKSRLIGVIVLVALVSIIPEILFREITGSIPGWLHYGRLAVLGLVAVAIQWVAPLKPLTKFVLLLMANSLGFILINLLTAIVPWTDFFPRNTFLGNLGGDILLSIIQVIPVLIALLVLFKGPKAAYLGKGYLSVKAEEIKWLGIHKDWVSWGRLAVISGLLISLGTILLTVITVTGAAVTSDFSRLAELLPVILVMALFNALAEGIVYRSMIISALRKVLPKNQLILVAAVLFGIAHYYGAPGGIIGVGMSGVLGWYMCRSMVETRGFVSSWIIHTMQDVVIFSTLLVLGNFG